MKFDSANSLIFSQSFQAPDITWMEMARKGYIIGSDYYQHITFIRDSVISAAAILKVDSAGNMTLLGEKQDYSFINQCRKDIHNGATQLVRDSIDPHFFVTLGAVVCSNPFESEFKLVKYSSRGFTFEGKIFSDLDIDKHFDNGQEYGLAHQRILLLPDSSYAYTEGKGKFSFTTDSFPRTITYNAPVGSSLTTDSTSFHLAPGLSDSCCYDFGLTEFQPVHDLQCDVTAMSMRCDRERIVWVRITNNGSVPELMQVRLELDSQTTFLSGMEPPTTLAGNVFTWTLDSLFPYASFQTAIAVNGPPGSSMGDTIHYSLEVTNPVTHSVLCSSQAQRVVRCSYDPNDKEVQPEGIGASHDVLAGERLYYTIQFQNTGNDTAFEVTLVDTLDEKFDLESFRVESFSHPVDIRIRAGRILECIFQQINLPDSGTSLSGSQGYFKYSILPKANLALPFEVRNRASIFFDSNPAIYTRQTLNTYVLALPSALTSPSDVRFSVYPNPVLENLTVDADLAEPSDIFLFDVSGRLLDKFYRKSWPIHLDCSSLVSGIYFLEIRSGGHTIHARFLKN